MNEIREELWYNYLYIFVSCGKEFRFYAKCEWKLLEDFEHRNDMIRFSFLKNHSVKSVFIEVLFIIAQRQKQPNVHDRLPCLVWLSWLECLL